MYIYIDVVLYWHICVQHMVDKHEDPTNHGF